MVIEFMVFDTERFIIPQRAKLHKPLLKDDTSEFKGTDWWKIISRFLFKNEMIFKMKWSWDVSFSLEQLYMYMLWRGSRA